MQTLETLVKQFNVNLKLTEVMTTKEIKGEFTDYHVDKDEEGRIQHVFDGTVLTPRVHPDTMKLLPDWLKENMSQGNILEQCQVIVTPDCEEEYLKYSTWTEGEYALSLYYDSNGEERGRS